PHGGAPAWGPERRTVCCGARGPGPSRRALAQRVGGGRERTLQNEVCGLHSATRKTNRVAARTSSVRRARRERAANIVRNGRAIWVECPAFCVASVLATRARALRARESEPREARTERRARRLPRELAANVAGER